MRFAETALRVQLRPSNKRRPRRVSAERFPGVDFSDVEADEDPLWKLHQREDLYDLVVR